MPVSVLTCLTKMVLKISAKEGSGCSTDSSVSKTSLGVKKSLLRKNSK